MDAFFRNARARNTHVEENLNHPFPAQVGSQEDKKGRTLAGTATLRKCIEGTSARRAFSLIFKDRTVDIEVATEDDARNTIRYFKVLVAEAKA